MEPIGLGEWLLIFLLFCIPIVNIIVVLATALGFGKRSLVNFSRALILWTLVIFAFAAVLYSKSGRR